MSDRVFLSLWFSSFNDQTMLAYWKKALDEFPVSLLLPGIRSLGIHPIDWAEAPVLDESFPEGATSDHVLSLASEFLHDDYAYEAGIHWDIWGAKAGDSLDQWERVSQMVRVACLGPAFDTDAKEDKGHLQIDFGMDSFFLPPADQGTQDQEAHDGVARSCFRDNIQQFLTYLRKLDAALPIERKLLWSGSGENLAEQIRSAWRLSS